MRLLRGMVNVNDASCGSVLTIGNFDGVHLGHQHLLQALKAIATSQNAKSMVMTFAPHPQAFFNPNAAPKRIMSWRLKWQAIEASGIDYLLRIPFTRKLAMLSAEAFIQELLINTLKVKHVLVGHDFRFGKKRLGDWHMLNAWGKRCGFTVSEASIYEDTKQRVSSSFIRELLKGGDIDRANHLLGRPYAIRGKVITGQGIGRTWGFPTANIKMDHEVALNFGIYVVRAYTAQHGWLPAVASYGVRPTLGQALEPLLEVHVLAGNYDFVGKQMKVDFMLRLRDELEFSTIDELQCAIKDDCQRALDYFNKLK